MRAHTQLHSLPFAAVLLRALHMTAEWLHREMRQRARLRLHCAHSFLASLACAVRPALISRQKAETETRGRDPRLALVTSEGTQRMSSVHKHISSEAVIRTHRRSYHADTRPQANGTYTHSERVSEKERTRDRSSDEMIPGQSSSQQSFVTTHHARQSCCRASRL